MAAQPAKICPPAAQNGNSCSEHKMSPRRRRILYPPIGGETRPSCHEHGRACIPKNADAISLQHDSPPRKPAATPDLYSLDAIAPTTRSEERRVGKEGGCRRAKAHCKIQKEVAVAIAD